jgi:hypothetical protein
MEGQCLWCAQHPGPGVHQPVPKQRAVAAPSTKIEKLGVTAALRVLQKAAI